MTNDNLLSLWRKVDLHEATSQEKIDAAWGAGESKDPSFLPKVRALLKDENEEVRYYALQAVVIDLGDKSQEIVKTCWNLLASDPDDHVRLMATSCLGKVYFNSRDPQSFHRVRLLLASRELSPLVKDGLYSLLFKIAGRPPREWPGFLERATVFKEEDIDWIKVAQLEDELENNFQE